jgi:acetyl esterase/lipase
MTTMKPTQIEPHLLEFRERINRNSSAANAAVPWPVEMQLSEHEATSLDGSVFEVKRFVPRVVHSQSKGAQPTRAVVFAFGGGFVAGSVDVFRNFIAVFAERSETQVFAPQWRTAPEHPYPAGVEDVYATIKWLQANSKQFNVDPARILIAGISAGATLAAGVTLLARDRGLEPPIAAQVLRYPTLNDQTELEPDSTREKMLWWNATQNETAWTAYMGGLAKHARNDATTPCYAAPARAKDFARLPPAHLGVGDYDLFRDEIDLYAQKLRAAGGRADYFNYPESPHGFDGVPGSVQGSIMWDREAAFIREF